MVDPPAEPSAPGKGIAVSAWASIALCTVAAVVLFGVGFGVMTDCTNNFSCGTSGCDPCDTANAWIVGGWVLLGLTFLLAVGVLLAHARGRTSTATRVAAAICLVAPVLVVAGVAAAAPRAYCNDPDEPAVDGGPNYCNV